MNSLATVAVVIFLTVVAPIIVIMHFITKWRQQRQMSKEDEVLIEDLWQLSQRLNDRIVTLERILDAESPDWRKNQ